MKFWPYFNPEEKQHIIEFNVTNFPSVAVFHQDDLSTPVAWTMQTVLFNILHLYTVEAHRRKHLAENVVARMCEVVIEDGLIPIAGIEVTNERSINLFKKVGFIVDRENSLHISRSNYF